MLRRARPGRVSPPSARIGCPGGLEKGHIRYPISRKPAGRWPSGERSGRSRAADTRVGRKRPSPAHRIPRRAPKVAPQVSDPTESARCRPRRRSRRLPLPSHLDGRCWVRSTLQEIDAELLGSMREHATAYAASTPVRRVAVVANAPLEPSVERRDLIDTSDLVDPGQLAGAGRRRRCAVGRHPDQRGRLRAHHASHTRVPARLPRPGLLRRRPVPAAQPRPAGAAGGLARRTWERGRCRTARSASR